MALTLLGRTEPVPTSTLWVFRYYDLDDRKFALYGQTLLRLIDLIRSVTVTGSMPPTHRR